jgi:thioredoxin-like negative regulator of GroEL
MAIAIRPGTPVTTAVDGPAHEGFGLKPIRRYTSDVPMSHLKPQRTFASLALVAILTGIGCGGSLTRAQDALAVGDEPTAEKHLRKAVKSSATEAEASRLLAVIVAKRGDELAADQPKQAEDHYREALALDTRNEAARVGLARLLLKRGFTQEANELLSAKGCTACGRLVSMMIHQNADAAYTAGDIPGARALYQQAFADGKDPLDALGIVRTYLVPGHIDLDQAVIALTSAASLISGGQVEAEQQFALLRAALLEAAAAAHNNDMIEALFKIKTYVLQEEPEYELRFRISQTQFRNGDSDQAIERITTLLENSGQYIDPTQREVMNAALVVMFGARAAQHLQAGDAVGAAKDIGAGLKIDPNNSRLKLQQVLAIAAGRLDLAFTQIEKVSDSKDKNEVQAILYSLRVLEELDAGKMAKVYEALDKAQQLGPNLPEVLLARAWVLAESRNEDIKKVNDLQDVRKLSGFSWPQGRVNQYAGALANLDRARRLVREQGVLHPFRGPGFEARATALKDKIAKFYPHKVQWHSGGAMLELACETGQKSAEYRGPRYLKGSAVASPGFPAEIPIKEPGIVYIDYDGKQIAVVVEANTYIIVNL